MALDYDNIIDADGHILEPADAWSGISIPPIGTGRSVFGRLRGGKSWK